MGNVKLLKDQKIIFESNTLDFVPDTIRYEVHYWNKKKTTGILHRNIRCLLYIG